MNPGQAGTVLQSGVSSGRVWNDFWAMLLAVVLAVAFSSALPGNWGIYIMLLLLLGYLSIHAGTFQALSGTISGAISSVTNAVTLKG